MYILVILLSFLVILICVKLDMLLGVSLLYPCAFIVLFLISLAEIGLLVNLIKYYRFFRRYFF